MTGSIPKCLIDIFSGLGTEIVMVLSLSFVIAWSELSKMGG